MEKIAIVADIHANKHALEVFMHYINNECKVTWVLNLGDFIQIGPNPKDVYDTVMNDSRFVNIMGNSEYMFFDEEIKKQYENEVLHQAWVMEQLGAERMQRLKELPLKRTIEIEDKKFLMIHSRLDSVVEQPLLYAQKPFDAFIADYNEAVNYVLIGHTHLPVYAVYWNNRPIINPGSLGLGKDGILRFVIAEIKDGMVDISYKQLQYDKEKVIFDYRRFEVPEGETFMRKFF